MNEQNEFYFIHKNSELYLSSYLLKRIPNIPIWQEEEDIYEVFPYIFHETGTLPFLLQTFLNNNIVQSILCMTHLSDKEIVLRNKFTKEEKTHSIDKQKITNIYQYFETFTRNERYQVEIYLENINDQKLQATINTYLQTWEQNKFQSTHTNFYKKEKQIELVTKHIEELLKDYSNHNLIINMRNFNDGGLEFLIIYIF